MPPPIAAGMPTRQPAKNQVRMRPAKPQKNSFPKAFAPSKMGHLSVK